MYKISIICLGKLKESGYKQLEAEFSKRLSPFAKFQIIELAEEPYFENTDLDKVRFKEAQKIKKQIKSDSVVVMLEEAGLSKDSLEFASFIERIGSIQKEIVFILGSGIGLDPSVKEFSNYTLSLSPMTFPHNMARVVLVEQIYRAMTILSGKDYHK
ncbi:MAG: 23S rRNA (pseudouridine(1915)-N(3))-methyltransferase RlmH [Candidatus Doudnabacteria bacterium]